VPPACGLLAGLYGFIEAVMGGSSLAGQGPFGVREGESGVLISLSSSDFDQMCVDIQRATAARHVSSRVGLIYFR
jgi:hypothetical protein